MRTGYIIGRNGEPAQITFEVQGELAILEGDIVLGLVSQIATSPEQLHRAGPDGVRFGIVINGNSYRWPNGVVPYTIDPSLPNPARVTDAIAHIEATTPGVDLVPRSAQADYVRFVPSTGCSSNVGRIGGPQIVNLASGCDKGATVHEITHALGLFHEQSRCNRDTYVEILWANIQVGKEHNFQSACNIASDFFEYAEGSLMHYPPTAFSVNGQPTIRSKRGLDHLMGQRVGLGTTDISTINQFYPPPSGGWVTKSAMPTARKQFAAGTATSVLYVVGGTTAGASNVIAKVEAYNPATNSWTTKAPLPSARWRTGGATGIAGLLYVAGGVGTGTAGHMKTLYAYKTSTNTWSTKAAMPVAGGCGGSAAINGILFVVVGCDVSTSSTSGAKGILLRYDPASNTWSTKAPAPTPHQFGGVAAVAGKLYVVGGKNGSVASTKLEVYNPGTNTWATKAPLPAARHSHTTYAINGKLYVLGGNNASNAFMNTVYVYDPAIDRWSTGRSMPTARSSFGGGTVGGVLYAVGGYNSAAVALATNESLIP
jgi:N-acetylneuraminic acid mutarotase